MIKRDIYLHAIKNIYKPTNIYMHFKYLHSELDHDKSVVPGVRPGPGGGL